MPSNDLTIYSDFAHEWWIPGAPRFRSLQNITPFRLELIREFCGPLSGKDVVDLGCGGGLISIPLIQQGANIVGIDQSAPSLNEARRASGGQGVFLQGDVCRVPLPSACADVVLLADVLDHVPHVAQALCESVRILRSNGKLFVGTINRNCISWFFAIFLGEGMRLIPRGTHDYTLFLKPEEIVEIGRSLGLKLRYLQGEWPNLCNTLRHWAISLRRSRSCLVAYSILFEKVDGAEREAPISGKPKHNRPER